MTTKTPKKWIDVYPQGTKEGDEEQKFFIALERNQKYKARSTGQIAKETGLPVSRVEQIIKKYVKSGIVVPHESKDDHWRYWENADLIDKPDGSIADTDKKNRIKNFKKSSKDN